MKLHVIEHAPGEGPGEIAGWAARHGHELATTRLFQNEPLPEPHELDWLVLMGGPMNVYEYRAHPWLRPERPFIERVIASGKRVLGVCLGAQLIADVLGGKVYQNDEIEIGWFPVRLTEAAAAHPVFAGFPGEFTPLHWHGDTYSLPAGAVHVAESDGCKNQAFVFGEHVVGLQFHIETQLATVDDFIAGILFAKEGRFVQTPGEIRAGGKHIPAAHAALHAMLDAMATG